MAFLVVSRNARICTTSPDQPYLSNTVYERIAFQQLRTYEDDIPQPIHCRQTDLWSIEISSIPRKRNYLWLRQRWRNQNHYWLICDINRSIRTYNLALVISTRTLPSIWSPLGHDVPVVLSTIPQPLAPVMDWSLSWIYGTRTEQRFNDLWWSHTHNLRSINYRFITRPCSRGYWNVIWISSRFWTGVIQLFLTISQRQRYSITVRPSLSYASTDCTY